MQLAVVTIRVTSDRDLVRVDSSPDEEECVMSAAPKGSFRVRGWWVGAVGVAALVVPTTMVWANGSDKASEVVPSYTDAKKLAGNKLWQGDHLVVSPDGKNIAADGRNDRITRWVDGDLYTTAVPGKDANKVVGANSDGVVVGLGSDWNDDGTVEMGWRYQNSHADKLKGLGDLNRSYPRAVAEDGTIVGQIRDENNEKNAAVRWAPGELEPTILHTPDDDQAEDLTAIDISADGSTIIGSVDKTSWVWDDRGDATKIPTPSSSYHGGVVAIAGDWVLTKSQSHFYRLDISKDDPKLEEVKKLDAEAAPADIDAEGRVSQRYKDDAVIVDTDNKMTTLDGLSDESGLSYGADAITPDGAYVVGTAEEQTDDPEYPDEPIVTPVMWTCK